MHLEWRPLSQNGSRQGPGSKRPSDEATTNVFGWKDRSMAPIYGEEQSNWAVQEASELLARCSGGEPR